MDVPFRRLPTRRKPGGTVTDWDEPVPVACARTWNPDVTVATAAEEYDDVDQLTGVSLTTSRSIDFPP